MSKEIHTQKHMTLSDRIFIEQALANHDSFKDIAADKKTSTISKEIRKHRAFKEGRLFGHKCKITNCMNGGSGMKHKIFYRTGPKFSDQDLKDFSRGSYECRRLLQNKDG